MESGKANNLIYALDFFICHYSNYATFYTDTVSINNEGMIGTIHEESLEKRRRIKVRMMTHETQIANLYR